ncbi:MAG: hypothetical protein ACKV0T_27260 [Planctomycetales bacterium]
MALMKQIGILRRRFLSGDAAARDALQNLLRTYLVFILRRAARNPDSESGVTRGIRRLSSASPSSERSGSLPRADDLCRKLCDELLRLPALGTEVDRILETIRSVSRTAVVYQG